MNYQKSIQEINTTLIVRVDNNEITRKQIIYYLPQKWYDHIKLYRR